MGLLNVEYLREDELSIKTRRDIRAFIKRGFKRNHLVVNDKGHVFFDIELAKNEAFDEIIYYFKARSNN